MRIRSIVRTKIRVQADNWTNGMPYYPEGTVGVTTGFQDGKVWVDFGAYQFLINIGDLEEL